MDEKFSKLSDLGAGDFEHLDGTLIDHLKGTAALLAQWDAPLELQDAGLYHAAYGTAGFEESFVSTSRRSDIAKIIGTEAEEIVYQYCACDRQYFFPQFETTQTPIFKDRFTGELYSLSANALNTFCELTAANETEIAIDNPAFMAEHGKGLAKLFTNMSPFLSNGAKNATATVFDINNV